MHAEIFGTKNEVKGNYLFKFHPIRLQLEMHKVMPLANLPDCQARRRNKFSRKRPDPSVSLCKRFIIRVSCQFAKEPLAYLYCRRSNSLLL